MAKILCMNCYQEEQKVQSRDKQIAQLTSTLSKIRTAMIMVQSGELNPTTAVEATIQEINAYVR